MFSYWLLFCVTFLLRSPHNSRACNNNENANLYVVEGYPPSHVNLYEFHPIHQPYYYQFFNKDYSIQGRTPAVNEEPEQETNYENPVEGRFGYNHWDFSPFNKFSNQIKLGKNSFANLIDRLTYASCKAPSGETGVCVTWNTCLHLGGRPSGNCNSNGVCCINVINTCGASTVLNNTYWQSPVSMADSSSSCALTIKLDKKLTERKKSICQIRLDFISFSIAQPTHGHCTDYFRTSIDHVPYICGENYGQHTIHSSAVFFPHLAFKVYLDIPDSETKPSTTIQLEFYFSKKSTHHLWNIKIAMLPCGASYLAPLHCLQYFTSTTGQIMSFNWKDVQSTTGTRQLNNQQYNICFRTGVTDSHRADKLCISACKTTTKGAEPFFLSGSKANSRANNNSSYTNGLDFQTSTAIYGYHYHCTTDYIYFLGGKTGDVFTDRFCGSMFPNHGKDQVCSSIKPFRLTLITDEHETTHDENNQGFCLNFQQL